MVKTSSPGRSATRKGAFPAPVSSAVAAGGAVAAALVFLLAHRSIGDDSYITLSYARNLALHGHWGLIEATTANTATSPLNVLLLAALILLTGQPVLAVGLLLAASSAVLAVWALRISETLELRPPWLFPAATVGLLLVNPLLVSTIGLEMYLGAALVVGLVRFAIRGQWVLFGVLAGLVFLCRPDLVVFDVVVGLGVAAVRRRIVPAALVGVVVAAPWHVLSWFVLGSAIPDTFALKTVVDHFAGGETFATGPLMYGSLLPVASALAAVPAAVGLLCALGWCWVLAFRRTARPTVGSTAVTPALAGLAHSAVFLLMGTPPYLWYYAPLIIGLVLCATLTAAALVSAASGRTMLVGVPGVLTVLLAATVVFDVSRGVPWLYSPMHTNFAATRRYAEVGRELSELLRPGQVVVGPGEVGVLAFHCECAIVDFYSDPGRTRVFVRQRIEQAGPLVGALLEFNYRNRRASPPIPADFRLSLEPVGASSGLRSWKVFSPLHGYARLVLREV